MKKPSWCGRIIARIPGMLVKLGSRAALWSVQFWCVVWLVASGGFIGQGVWGDERIAGKSELSRPYRPSPSLQSIRWHWETYQTAAPGSDLWPVTWGPDDNLYAAWGDGGGFGGSDTEGRVALGFARIEGGPEGWRGVNVNGGKNPEVSPQLNRGGEVVVPSGQGPEPNAGTRTSPPRPASLPTPNAGTRRSPPRPASFPTKGKTLGIGFIDGVLYAMVNLQDGRWPDVDHVVAWSDDKGATWKQCEWRFPKGEGNFQPATFLCFGRDYTGLPANLAGFVYLYGPAQSADGRRGTRLYLARAPREGLRERGAYEFFRGADRRGRPSWTAEWSGARPVFTDPNGVTPPSAVYNPALKRFLFTCFHTGPGQLGVFEGPSPWGPWRTVAYYEDWGGMGSEGEGLSCSFPQKWMSADGRTLWCVFSVYGQGAKQGINGHDKFNLVRATLE